MKFEESMKRLEEIARTLEEGSVSLDDSVAFFEEGIDLYRQCMKKLTETEKRIEMLVKDKDGELTIAKFPERLQEGEDTDPP